MITHVFVINIFCQFLSNIKNKIEFTRYMCICFTNISRLLSQGRRLRCADLGSSMIGSMVIFLALSFLSASLSLTPYPLLVHNSLPLPYSLTPSLSLSHSPTYSLTPSLSLINSLPLTHFLTPSPLLAHFLPLTQSLPPSLSLTHSLTPSPLLTSSLSLTHTHHLPRSLADGQGLRKTLWTTI